MCHCSSDLYGFFIGLWSVHAAHWMICSLILYSFAGIIDIYMIFVIHTKSKRQKNKKHTQDQMVVTISFCFALDL